MLPAMAWHAPPCGRQYKFWQAAGAREELTMDMGSLPDLCVRVDGGEPHGEW